MKHLLITRLWFDNTDMIDRYLDIALNTFIPSLKAQTCKDFEFGILIREVHVDYVREKIGVDFTPFTGGIEQYREIPKKHGYTLQTRHDFDDWMREDYIETIQKTYRENKDKYDSFIIHVQPIKVTYPDMKEVELAPYHDKRISMFATMCQKDPVYPVYKGSHGHLWKFVDGVIELPKGYTKWVQHENTVTNTRLKAKGIQKVGNMRLYDPDHNWISERNIDPVINVLTRTYRRPKSFAICRESVMSQTYIKGDDKFNDRSMKINHIVGCEEECPYYPDAIRLSKKEGKFLPWNLHLNDLGEHVKTGWVMYLDDDDMFSKDTSVEEIVQEIDHEDQLLIWKVQINTWTAPNDKHFGKVIKKGQVSGIGMLFHSKHLPVPWEARPAGDFHVIEYLSKKLEVKWVNNILTKVQGGKNNHGKMPDIEKDDSVPVEKVTKYGKNIFELTDNKDKPQVSVGTPIWRNGSIYWLSIESLCRQKTDVPWELVVMECPSVDEVGADYFKDYLPRLKDAGCQRVTYVMNEEKVLLTTKWKKIAELARADILIMHDGDDYTHPLRVQRTVEKIGDKPWYDTRFAWHYLIPTHQMLEYDYRMINNLWKTGFNIALKRDIVLNAPDPQRNKGVHGWLADLINDKVVDDEKYPCLATTGANSVSKNRKRSFKQPIKPWRHTDVSIWDIGLPNDIVSRLIDMSKHFPAGAMSINEPVISVLIPYKDDGDVIVDTINTLNDDIDTTSFEIIVIDDGSTNPPPKEINEHRNVRVIRNNTNKGVGFSFDRGVVEAHGDVILLMGCDITVNKRSWLKQALSLSETYPESICCATCVDITSPSQSWRGRKRYHGADLLFRVTIDDLPKGIDYTDKNYKDIMQCKKRVADNSIQPHEVPSVFGGCYVIKRDWYIHIGGWGHLKGTHGLTNEECKWTGHSAWGGLEPIISLKSWFAGGSCIVDPAWEAGHLFNRWDKVKKTRGRRMDRYFFNKLFAAHTLLTEKQANKLSNYLHKTKNENWAKSVIKKNRKAIDMERDFNDNIKKRGIEIFEERFGYDLSWLK